MNIENHMVLPTASDNFDGREQRRYQKQELTCSTKKCPLCGDFERASDMHQTADGLICNWCFNSPDNNYKK